MMIVHKQSTAPGGSTVCGKDGYSFRRRRRDGVVGVWKLVNCEACIAKKSKLDTVGYGTYAPPTIGQYAGHVPFNADEYGIRVRGMRDA